MGAIVDEEHKTAEILMIDFMTLRLKPIELCDLTKGEAHTILFAKPSPHLNRPVVWYSTELVFSRSLDVWESRDKCYPSYYYDSLGSAQRCDKPNEAWEELQLFSPH